MLMRMTPSQERMNMTIESFEAFKQRKLMEGYDEVLIRQWEPNLCIQAHEHPFETHALVVEGDFWLGLDGTSSHLQAGDEFHVGFGQTHTEAYGPKGAVFWAARKNSGCL
jgi:hypothetical protein